MKQLILAANSPRRQEMFHQLKIPFTVRTGNVDETVVTTTNPAEKVKQLARLKGNSVSLAENEIVLAADTVVAFEGKIFGKPKSKQEAYDMMSTLSGQTHEVYTGVFIRSQENEVTFVERTSVTWWPLSETIIQWYINSDEPYDKAGGYGIQNLGAILVKKINGDYFNVVGLPISRVVRELTKLGLNIFHKP